MGLSAPAMAQEVNYKDMLKPIETTLKSGNSHYMNILFECGVCRVSSVV